MLEPRCLNGRSNQVALLKDTICLMSEFCRLLFKLSSL